jgi:type II secretory ATPase GspE/PulE/Tfp pilus assembly ATPase PilB-like protein
MNINHKIGLTFASGLRTILRQDPDVIMIGECRDGETAGMAIEASLTGHIVFSTIHTNDSVGVVSRLIDMGVDSYLVATALTVSIAQRLVRTLCPHCKSVADGAIILDQLMDDGVSRQKIKELNIDIDPETPYVRAVGCQQCRHSGYIGRQAVFELFEMTSEGRAIVVTQNFNSDQLRQVALENGMTTLVQSGLRLVDEGATTHAEVIKVLGEQAAISHRAC